MHYLRNRRLETKIVAVGVDAGVVGEALSMAAEAERVVRLIEVSGAEDEFGLAVALKTCSRHNVEDAIGAITELGAVTSAIDLEIIDVLGIELRAEVGGDIGVGNRYAVDEPTGLVSTADVELIVGDIGAGHVVGDHGEAVGARSPGRALDIEAADQGDGSGGVRWSGLGSSGDVDDLLVSGHAQRKMQNGL